VFVAAVLEHDRNQVKVGPHSELPGLALSCFFLPPKQTFFNPVEADGIVSRFAESVKEYPENLLGVLVFSIAFGVPEFRLSRGLFLTGA
jgi:hypothetical protein